MGLLDLRLVPEPSSMGTLDVRKRRNYRWPKEARDLAREYREGVNRSQERDEGERRMLITKPPRYLEIHGTRVSASCTSRA